MFEDFLQTLPDSAQQCIKHYCSNGKCLITTAAFLRLDVIELKTILSEVEMEMEAFLGAKTINNIELARNEKDVSEALAHFKSNVLKYQVSKMLKRPY